jgi:hypothetical protein
MVSEETNKCGDVCVARVLIIKGIFLRIKTEHMRKLEN